MTYEVSSDILFTMTKHKFRFTDHKNTKELDPEALLRGCLLPRSWLSTVLSELRGGRHPLKSAPTSNFLSFPSSLGPKLVLHISGCLKNPSEALLRGCPPPRSSLSTVLCQLRGGRHPLKSASGSKSLVFLWSLGPKLVLHISEIWNF